jgi:hypothetical protein
MQTQGKLLNRSGIPAFLKEVAVVLPEHRVVKLGGNIGQGFEDKTPLVQAGVWDGKKGGLYRLIAVIK